MLTCLELSPGDVDNGLHACPYLPLPPPCHLEPDTCHHLKAALASNEPLYPSGLNFLLSKMGSRLLCHKVKPSNTLM